MKRRVIPAAALAALLVLGCALAFALQPGRVTTLEARQSVPYEERPVVQAELTYNPGTRMLRGTQRITAVNRSGRDLDRIALRLYMNGEDAQAVTVSGVAVGSGSARARLDEDDATLLKIDYDWANGEEAEIVLSLVIRCPAAQEAALVTLPQLCVLEDGVWRTDAFDVLAGRSFAQAFDYRLDVVVPDGTAAAFGGALTGAERDEEGTRYTAQMQGARDITFALQSGGCLRQKKAGGVLLSALAQDGWQARKQLARAQEAIESLGAAGFSYPFDALTLVCTDTAVFADGESASGIIALAPQADRETMLRSVTRLCAQQIFGIQTGCDMIAAPWLSHSLASAAEILAYRSRRGEGAYQARLTGELEPASRVTRPYGVSVGAGISSFGSAAEMAQVLRDQGGMMLLGICEAAGYDAFVQALRRYSARGQGQIAGQALLEAALYEATGSRWDGYLADELRW